MKRKVGRGKSVGRLDGGQAIDAWPDMSPGFALFLRGQGQARLHAEADRVKEARGGVGKSHISLRRSRVLYLGGLCEPEPRNGVGFPLLRSGRRTTTVEVLV